MSKWRRALTSNQRQPWACLNGEMRGQQWRRLQLPTNRGRVSMVRGEVNVYNWSIYADEYIFDHFLFLFLSIKQHVTNILGRVFILPMNAVLILISLLLSPTLQHYIGQHSINRRRMKNTQPFQKDFVNQNVKPTTFEDEYLQENTQSQMWPIKNDDTF